MYKRLLMYYSSTFDEIDELESTGRATDGHNKNFEEKIE
jgi:hypothetical protein